MNQAELLRTFTLANEFKEGDLAIGGTRDAQTRQLARQALAALRLADINKIAFVEDEVSETLARSLNRPLADELATRTVAEVKERLAQADAAAWARRYCDGLSSESIAAVVKLMSNDELAALAGKLFNPLPDNNVSGVSGVSGVNNLNETNGVAIGSPRHFGSRIQPNSPGDSEEEILFSILEGLSYGCGDVILGINPASDDVETIVALEELLCRVVERLELPTRYCVLSDIVKQSSARARARVDVGFQSLAGTSQAINGMVGLGVDGLLDLARGFAGLYFETGQGSAVTNNAAAGVDMVTLESRAYGVARYLRQQTGSWMIVNDVAGFIGPEVFCSTEQLQRACLEDTVMAKLHGITMGLDVCATFHMGIDPDTLQRLTATIVEQAQPAYLMAVAGNADPMLGYLTTSFREHPRLRRQNGKQMTTAMQRRLAALGVLQPNGAVVDTARTTAALYARYVKACGDTRALDTLREEGAKKLAALGERGFDLGYGCAASGDAPPAMTTRLQTIYAHARRALYATLDASVIKDACPASVRVRTRSASRDEYLAHPASGEALDDRDASRIAALYATRRPQIQMVISDGLNAEAVNENLRAVLPALRRQLMANGYDAGAIDVVIENGRVRAGYQVGALLDVEATIHLIGERPGTGLNTLSAYLTYGRDRAGNSRWHQGIDHSQTTAICGINRQGKPPAAAVEEIARCVKRIFAQRASGVTLAGE